jgi:hypothetical protein
MKTIYQKLCHTAKVGLRGKFIAMNAYIKNTEKYQINDIMLHLKLLGKQEQVKHKTTRSREKIKIRAKISEIETKTKNKNKESTKQKAGTLKK